MARAPRSINRRKLEALLETATTLLAEHGRDISVSEIARRSGVSRQTIYNHFADKNALLDGLLALRAFSAHCPVCPEPAEQPIEGALAAYAATLLDWVLDRRHATSLRAMARGFNGAPDAARQQHRATLGRAVRRLAEILAQETARGRLQVADPAAAAELFLDLVIARPQLEIVEGSDIVMTPAQIHALSWSCARLFARGYAPDPAPAWASASAI